MRFVVRVYLFWQRVEVFLASLLSLGLIIESSIANGFAYAGSDTAWLHLSEAMLRGFFLEVFTYCAARLAHSLLARKRPSWFGGLLMAGLCLVAVFVSSGNNFVWVAAGHNLAGLLGSIGALFGDVSSPWVRVYELGLSMLLPIAVAGTALVDTSHLVEAALSNDRLDNRAVDIEEREMLRSAYLSGLRAQKTKLRDAFAQIAEERAQHQIDRLRKSALSGDLPSQAFSTSLPSAPGSDVPSLSAAPLSKTPDASTVADEVKLRRIPQKTKHTQHNAPHLAPSDEVGRVPIRSNTHERRATSKPFGFSQ